MDIPRHYLHSFLYTSRHSRTESLCEADASPDARGAGTGGSWWLNNTGDSVAREVQHVRGVEQVAEEVTVRLSFEPRLGWGGKRG